MQIGSGAAAGRVGRRRGGAWLGLRLHRLLGGADLEQALGARDVGHGERTALLAVGGGGLAPAVGAHAQLLAEEGGEDLGLLLTEARERAQAGQQLVAARGALPDVLGL